MSVVATVSPITYIPLLPMTAPLIIAAGIGAALMVATANPKASSPTATSFSSEISEEHRQMVYSALDRIETLHGIEVSKWDRDFLNIKIENSNLVLEITDLRKTTLRGQAEIEAFLNLLNEETQRLVQDKLYSDIIEKANSKGLELQAESVEDDETIVLTYRIP